jgi:hypothetical protein
LIPAARSSDVVLLPLFGTWSDIRVKITRTQMGRGLHMGMVNVVLPLTEAGRNHLLATYIITGFVASLTYAVS